MSAERQRKLQSFVDALYDEVAPVMNKHAANALIFGIPVPTPEQIAEEVFQKRQLADTDELAPDDRNSR